MPIDKTSPTDDGDDSDQSALLDELAAWLADHIADFEPDPDFDACEAVTSSLDDGDWPSEADLSNLLRGPYEITRQVRDHAADRLEGKNTPRGRKSTQNDIETIRRRMVVQATYDECRAERQSGSSPERMGSGDALDRTVERLKAKTIHMSRSSVSQIIHGK